MNGAGNTVHLNDASNIAIGQIVWLSSDTIRKVRTRVVNLQQVGPSDWLLTLDIKDLEHFKTSDDARLNTYLPGTTNSNQSIFIPSDQPPSAFDEDLLAIPGVNIFDPLLRAAGVDFRVDDNFNLVVTAAGDNPLPYGLQGIVQRIRIIMSTPQYSLLQHPQFGFNARVGTNVANLDLTSLNADIEDLLVGESGIVSLQSLQADLTGPKLALTLQLGIVGLNTPVNLRVAVNT